MLTNQSPVGNTTHKLTAGSLSNPLNVIATLSGLTQNSQWLEWSGSTVARYIRITTTVSPSWVSWWEIEVFGN